MWIIPNNLQLSSGAPGTAGFISDLNEQSQICASSLMVRSKPSPSRTWSLKWKRDSWTALLSGRILKPSHARTFVTEWTSLWPVTHASHSAQQERDSAQKTRATSGHTSPDQYELFDLDYASLRMSKDTSALASEKSLESWNQSVIKARGEYSRRLKSEHRTNASGFSSWPTISVNESKNSVGKSQLSRNCIPLGTMAMMIAESHASFVATNSTTNCLENTDAQTAVVKDAANCLTPQEDDASNVNPKDTRRAGLVSQVNGQAAPANPSTDGSRQGLSEQSQRNWQTFAHGTHNRGETPHRQVVKALVNGEKAQTQCLTVDQVFAEEIKGTNLASTPEVAQKRIEEGKVTLSRQNPGKLNPRWVETLQGVCMGWTSPSCPASVIKNWPKFVSGWCAVTIEPTSFDSSATESCLQQQNEPLEF